MFRRRKAIGWVVLLAVIAYFGARAFDVGPFKRGGEGGEGVVTRVVDGDTIKVRVDGGEETVRYIGVDTPESVKPGVAVECFAKAASHFNEDLVEGERVKLSFDRERRDRYGRLLAYVRLAGPPRTFVNAELVRDGYAKTLAIAPNTTYAKRFNELADRARAAGRGLWGACPIG